MITILGAGISGISAGYHLKKRGIKNIIFEKSNTWGGLCDNFTIGNGFRFDYFVHLSFTKSDYVKNLFAESADFIKHNPVSKNYYKGKWLKHPAQNNLAPLSSSEKVKIVIDFINKPTGIYPKNYKEWLLFQFGEYFVTNFPSVYTKKYWTLPPDNLTNDWLEGRFSVPNLEKLLLGAFEEQQENFYYADEMRYPKVGGYKSFLNLMASECDIHTSKEVILIDMPHKRIFFADGSSSYFEKLISSIPLPELIGCIKDVPKNVTEASNKLVATSGQLVSIGFNHPGIAEYLWFYIYDEDILPARAYSPSLKSPDNVPNGKSSLQFETFYSTFEPKKLNNDNLIEHIVEKGRHMKLWSLEDIEITDCRDVKYANVIFDKNRSENLKIVHGYLNSIDISYIGRFGEWDYLWSDQSLLSGKRIAENV